MSLSTSDVMAIAEAKYRYAITLDSRDWTAYRRLFGDVVTVDFRGLGYRGEPRSRSADWWVDQVKGLLPGFAVTQHVMSGPIVEDAGDGDASLVMYLQAHHRLDADDPDSRHYTIGGRYEDRLRRSGDGWVFTAVTLHTLWTIGDGSVMAEAAARARDRDRDRSGAHSSHV